MSSVLTMALMPGSLRLGRLYIPIHAFFASLGLVSALFLSERTAKQIKVAPEEVWNVGIFTIVLAFTVSRLSLMLFNFHAFLTSPLLLLGLPSFTLVDLLLSVAILGAYLHTKALPVRSITDAWTSPLCLLAGTFELGHYVEGTAAGMPSSLPWATRTPGDTVLGPVQPVQLYGALAAVLVGTTAYKLLLKRFVPGFVTGVGLVFGGLASFLLDMLRQPDDSLGTTWLDPSQFLALASILLGLYLWWSSPRKMPLATPAGLLIDLSYPRENP